MRKLIKAGCALMALCILMVLAAPAMAETPRILLYTAYLQMGWGDRMQAGAVDENGNLWTLSGSAGELDWPYGWEAQLEYMQENSHMNWAGKLTSDELFNLKSLIYSVEDQGKKTTPWMNDAGTEKSYAVLYDQDGTAEAILLGLTGDDLFENTDPNAQALYLRLREMFPQVTCYAGMAASWGFVPVNIAQYLHLDADKIAQAQVRCSLMDCEAGPIEMELAAEEQQEVIDLVLRGTVTGKDNATMVTGGTAVYSFYDADGTHLGSIELYQGLLVTRDGMYRIQR